MFTQALSHLLQVVAGPLIQSLQEELERNRRAIEGLRSEREELVAVLNASTTSDSEV